MENRRGYKGLGEYVLALFLTSLFFGVFGFFGGVQGFLTLFSFLFIPGLTVLGAWHFLLSEKQKQRLAQSSSASPFGFVKAVFLVGLIGLVIISLITLMQLVLG